MHVVKRNPHCKMEANGTPPTLSKRVAEKNDRNNLVLWKNPATTLYYFLMECFYCFTQLRFTVSRNKRRCFFIVVISVVLLALNYTNGPHTTVFQRLKKTTFWWGWWIWLGFLSSCGFGTGLHTFVLYLGPFIAEVTMSAYECKTLKFPSPPYPDRIVCPEGTHLMEKISFLRILRKVQMESIMWVRCSDLLQCMRVCITFYPMHSVFQLCRCLVSKPPSFAAVSPVPLYWHCLYELD
ncbi:hypothetical protein PHET_10933 [Paragonimus heterotremus]|uniref:Vacuole membrane protein 1 n=1 Tax=Paragonimus heterotremus TaxID=100268 RepID=A0A8J4SFZ2_9TREM|nr:hypothetical protein PHET_10933 [Paragonimus heterotremus]